MRRWNTLVYIAIVMGSAAFATVQPAQLLDPQSLSVADTLTTR